MQICSQLNIFMYFKTGILHVWDYLMFCNRDTKYLENIRKTGKEKRIHKILRPKLDSQRDRKLIFC